jgi:hypothetical protein
MLTELMAREVKWQVVIVPPGYAARSNLAANRRSCASRLMRRYFIKSGGTAARSESICFQCAAARILLDSLTAFSEFSVIDLSFHFARE